MDDKTKADNMCRIPIEASYKIIDGKAVMVDALWEDIPADVIARFLLRKFGADAIFGGSEA